MMSTRREPRRTVGTGVRQLTDAPVSSDQVHALGAVHARVTVTFVDLRLTVRPCTPRSHRIAFTLYITTAAQEE